ncbi:MAG: ATP-binding protein [Deltaproteobacteria bacterium]|nr:ATP-binding protein [Deltaproteobacteria bacterium]
MKKTFFPTNNYHVLVKAIDALKNRDPSLPGLGLIYGRWGLGKTEAIEHYYGESNIYYVRVMRTWRVRDLLRDGICEEYKIYPEYRTVDCFKQVCKEIRRRGEPLFIDEADYVFKHSMMLDVLRDIHDTTRVPIILVGMEEICGKLGKFGQFWSRILPAGIVEFKPLLPPEMSLITKEWCDLEIAPEAAEIICRFTEGDFRYVVGYLLELEKACAVNKTREISQLMVEALLKKMATKKDISDRFRSTDVKRLRIAGRKAV